MFGIQFLNIFLYLCSLTLIFGLILSLVYFLYSIFKSFCKLCLNQIIKLLSSSYNCEPCFLVPSPSSTAFLFIFCHAISLFIVWDLGFYLCHVMVGQVSVVFETRYNPKFRRNVWAEFRPIILNRLYLILSL